MKESWNKGRFFKWNKFKRETGYIVPFSLFAWDHCGKPPQKHVGTHAPPAPSIPSSQLALSAVCCSLIPSRSFLPGTFPLAPATVKDLSPGKDSADTRESLDHQFSQAGCQRSWWWKSQQRRQLSAPGTGAAVRCRSRVISSFMVHEGGLQFSFALVLLLSFSLAVRPSAFHLSAVTQGPGHGSCFFFFFFGASYNFFVRLWSVF